jgi:predicted dehydrogenase
LGGSNIKVNVAVSGCGVAGQEHIRSWRNIREVELVAIHDVNEVVARQVANKWRIKSYYTDFSEMLRKEDLQVVSIATPPITHVPLALQAIDAGVNVLVEKPLSTSSEDAEKLLPLIEKKNVKVAVVNNLLFHEGVRKARKHLKDGTIGKIISCDIHFFVPSWSVPPDTHWVYKLPGGPLQEPLAHPIYLLQDILGDELEVKDVLISKIGSHPLVPYDELRVSLTADNLIGHIHISYNIPRTATYIFIQGTNGAIVLELATHYYKLIKPVKVTSYMQVLVDAIRQSYYTFITPATFGLKKIFKKVKTTHEENFRNFLRQVKDEPTEVNIKLESQIEALKIEEEIIRKVRLQLGK